MKVLDALARFLPGKASAGGVQRTSKPPASQVQDVQTRDQNNPAGIESGPADPSFPQLEVVMDPELMRGTLQRHLRPLVEGTYNEVWECRISYSLHREGFRCLVHYDLRLAEPGTGRVWNQLVTGVMYAGGRTRRAWKEMQRSRSGRETNGASLAFEPFTYIPDLDMLVQVFPYDHRLPALPLLMAGPPPEIEALLLERFEPGEWRAENWTVEMIRYRAVQRAALRLTVRAQDDTSGRTEERRFYAKVYLGGEKGANLGGEHTYQLLRELWDKATTQGVGFSVGRPIAYLSDLRTLLQEEAPGISFQYILRQEEEAIPAVRRAAKAVAALHLTDVVVPQSRHLRDEVARLEKAGKLLKSACPHLEQEIEKIVGAVVTGLTAEEIAPSLIHGDLKPLHVLLHGDDVNLIDLDKCAMADPMLDVANFLFTLDRTSSRSHLHKDHSPAVVSAFVEEYFALVPEAWRSRLPLHYAGTLLRKAAQTLRHQAPGWSDRIEALLKEAEDSLAGRVW